MLKGTIEFMVEDLQDYLVHTIKEVETNDFYECTAMKYGAYKGTIEYAANKLGKILDALNQIEVGE